MTADGTGADRPADEGRKHMQVLQKAGHQFLGALFSLLKTASIHDLNNRALDHPSAQAVEALDPFLRRAQGRIAAVPLDGQFYLDDIRIRLPEKAYEMVQELETLFRERGFGGVSFTHLPTAQQLKRFAHTVQHIQLPSDWEPLFAIQTAIRRSGVGGIGVTRPVRHRVELEDGSGTLDLSNRVDTTVTYAKAVSALQQLLDDPSGRARMKRRHLTRVVHAIADCAGETLDYLVGLTEAASGQRDHARLSVDACVVAVAVARSMGLPRALIGDLGITALTASEDDLGPDGRPGAPPIASLRRLLDAPRWNKTLLRRTLILAQRAQPVQGSGSLPEQYPLARIYRVAREYVALTHGMTPDGAEDREMLAPLEALSFLSQSPRRVYDPLVVAHLVNVVGVYPIGTKLRLSDNRTAYVLGRDDGDPLLLMCEGPRRFGSRVPLSECGAIVAGVVTNVDPGERSAAVLGAREQRAVQQVGESVASGSRLARVPLHRIAVKRPSETEGD